MNLKPNKHKRISFSTATMTSLGFVGTPLNLAPPKFNFLLRTPQLFWSEIFSPPPKIRGAATMQGHLHLKVRSVSFHSFKVKCGIWGIFG